MHTPARYLFAGVIAAGVVLYGEAPIAISSRFGFGPEPASFYVRITMPANPDNRSLLYGYDSEDGEASSSFEQVDGNSPEVFQRLFKRISAGHYTGYVKLMRAGGREYLATFPFEVISSR